MTPIFVLLAGPNGSGKSTISRTLDFKSYGFSVINPDDIAKEAPVDVNALIWAGREVHLRIERSIKEKMSFVVETTLSGNNHFKTIAACKEAGMLIVMHFVFVSSVTASKGRVRTRVGMGGHDVPEADQERRFERSLANAVKVVPVVDEAYFYDNSSREGHQLVAHFLNGQIEFISEAAPDWLKAAIRN